ncbi:MAG: hypothetical protein ACLUR5_02290 [Eubacterium ventriosum]
MYECKAKGKFRNKSIKPLVGDNVMVDIIDEEKKKETYQKFWREKNPAYKTGCGKCRSGNDSVCREKTKSKFESFR